MTAAAGIRQRRLLSSHLAGARAQTAEQVVGRLCAVQAQDYASARWAVAQRSVAETSSDIDALLAEGTMLRTHVLRPTWHIVLADDIRWLLRLTGPRVRAAMASTNRSLDLTEDVFARSNAMLAGELRGGGRMTRREIVATCRAQGVDAGGLRLAHLLMRAELDGVVCSGGLRGRQHTYALLDERARESPPLGHDEALGRLASRYFAGHGPALVDDFAWWSGLTRRQAMRGIEVAGHELERLDVEGRAYHAAAGAPSPPARAAAQVSLLADFDEYVVAYRDRSLHIRPSATGAQPPSAAILARNVVVDGIVRGRWRLSAGDDVEVGTPLLDSLSSDQRAALDTEVGRLGRFQNRPARLSSASP